MRFSLALNLHAAPVRPYSFNGKRISAFLEEEKKVRPAPYIALTTLSYAREKPGLMEFNWKKPWYDNKEHFIFLAGSVLFRSEKIKGRQFVPTPGEALEILLHTGEEHYRSLKGNYYILLLHKKDMAVEIYSSPMFMHPAFFSFINGQLVFSNYLEAFQHYHGLSVDKQGLVELALFDHCLHERSIYKNVKLIPGGHHFYFSGSNYKERKVYDVASWYTPTPRPRKDALEQINDALKKAITNYVNSTDKFNIAITGGFDGRLNFSFIEKADYPKLKAYSYGMPESLQISIPNNIARGLGFKYEPVFLAEQFEEAFPQLGMDSILLTCGVTGFNRGVYPYAYGKLKDFSRSCLIGQCDMIRPLFNNPAGVIFNDFSRSLFYGSYSEFKALYKAYAAQSFLDERLFTDEIADAIYEEVQTRYRDSYPHLSENLRFYFFLLKESLMKYWHTEFHLADIFVDDYVSFADLDYLEALFGSAYAGIYKGLLVNNQWERRTAHDLYIALMALNNDRLNYFYNDRFLKPGWLKYGIFGLGAAAAGKALAKLRDNWKGNDTFNMKEWAVSFYRANEHAITTQAAYFDSKLINQFFDKNIDDSGVGYRFNRMISTKIWLSQIGLC